MSFDFQLAHACPHLTIEEEVPLGNDRRELRVIQPVANATAVRVTANDDVVIPPTGLQSRAQLQGTVSGPFSIVKNENTITVSNRTSALEDFPLVTGLRVPADRIVTDLNAAFRTNEVNIFASNKGGYLVFTDLLDRGPRSRVRVSGLALHALGFTGQTRARGRKIYPPWSFDSRPAVTSLVGLTGVQDITVRFPRFTSPVKGNPVFKVSYTTYQEFCLRCQSFGIENDYRIVADGNPLTIENEDLLNQEVLKILTTNKGSNPFHPEYGTTLLERIGIKALGSSISTITEDVSIALQTLQRLQELQGQYQEVTPRERLASVLSVQTTPSEFDPTVFEVSIIASNASNQPVTITTVFASPGTAALAGSNGLSLGLEGFGLSPRTSTIPGSAARNTVGVIAVE